MSGDAPAAQGTDARGIAGGGLLRLCLAWIVPSNCAGCGTVRTGMGGGGACGACWGSIPELDPRLACPSCALPGPGGPCRECRTGSPPVARAAAYGEYEGRLRDLIGAYKFRGFDLLAAPFADRLARVARAGALDGPGSSVVGVPSTRSRNRRRGFDPAPLLARETARRLGLEPAAPLRRRGDAPPQSTLPKAGRAPNVAGAFEADARVAGRTVLLVDDIVTTGATAFAAARALRHAGASRVHLLVLARTPAPIGPTLPERA